jgi:ABC-type uncharacterized transport system fused permease/ATPase subunit
MKDICVQKKDGPRILVIRGQKVILDQDLALLYRVTTVSLNQAVRRNPTRFPNRFVLVVNRKEVAILISQNVISSSGWGGRRKPPMAFTEHGALMVASVLNSARAISMSIYVIEAFIKQREELATSEAILKRLAEIDRSLMVHDEALQDLYDKLLPLLQVEPEPKQRAIGFGV